MTQILFFGCTAVVQRGRFPASLIKQAEMSAIPNLQGGEGGPMLMSSIQGAWIVNRIAQYIVVARCVAKRLVAIGRELY